MGAWIAEKLSQAKIQLSEKEDREGERGFFLALEALALGITGHTNALASLGGCGRNRDAIAWA